MSKDTPHLLLITPPIYDFAAYDLFMKPYGLLRIGKWLQSVGYTLSYLNCLDRHDSFSDKSWGILKETNKGTGKYYRQILDPQPDFIHGIRRRLARYGIVEESIISQLQRKPRPDLILVSGIMTYWYKGVEEIIRLVRRYLSGVPVWAGGIYPSLMPDHCLQVCAPDKVLPGPAETELTAALEESGFPVPETPPDQTYWIDDPVWSTSAAIRLNEGCPNHCPYCASNKISPRFRASHPLQMADFVDTLFKKYGTRHFAFYDDALLVNQETQLIPFLKSILDRGLDLNFYLPNAVHIRYLNTELLILMKKAGFAEIRLGLESSDSEFIGKSGGKYLDKDLEAFRQAVEESGFDKRKIEGYVLAGFPGQTREELEQSIRYASSMGFRCRLARYSPVPGSAWWKKSCQLSRYPLEKEPLFHNNTFFPLEHPGLTRHDIEELKNLSDIFYHKTAI